MSIDHACGLAQALNISLDWLLLGRNGPDWLQSNRLSAAERDLIEILRERPARMTPLMITIAKEFPALPQDEQAGLNFNQV